MYSASSSSAHPQLRRAKSAPSVQKRRQYPLQMGPLDPETAKSQAMAAASHAMLKAREQSSHESSHDSSDQRGIDEIIARKILSKQRRPHSWRFSGDEPPLNEVSTASPPSLRPQTPNNTREDQNVYVELSPIQEFRGLSVEDTAAPSSYRRLRKARSMLATRHRMGSLSLRTPAHSDVQSSMDIKDHTEKANTGSLRRSLSFFNSANRPSSHLRRSNSQTAAVQLAREQYSEKQERSDQNLLPVVPRRKSRLEHRPFRKTFRSSSERDPGSLHASTDIRGAESGFHTKARTFSIHIKKRLRRVFGLRSSSEDHISRGGCKPAEVSFTGSSHSERERRIEE
jgi:hypothetical protein